MSLATFDITFYIRKVKPKRSSTPTKHPTTMKKMCMSVMFTMVPELVTEFITWMHDDHHRKMIKTGHFSGDIFRLVDESDPKKERVIVSYTLGIKSPESWDTYQAEDRPNLVKEFNDKWGSDIKSGRLQMMRAIGEGELLEHVL